jgi:hypothetical protein
MVYVVQTIFRGHHYADLWSFFLKVEHGMFYATIKKDIGVIANMVTTWQLSKLLVLGPI